MALSGGIQQRYFNNIKRDTIARILNELNVHGIPVNGNNPWNVETGQHGVNLRFEWSEQNSTLAISIAERNWYVPDELIWNRINSLIGRLEKTEGRRV